MFSQQLNEKKKFLKLRCWRYRFIHPGYSKCVRSSKKRRRIQPWRLYAIWCNDDPGNGVASNNSRYDNIGSTNRTSLPSLLPSPRTWHICRTPCFCSSLQICICEIIFGRVVSDLYKRARVCIYGCPKPLKFGGEMKFDREGSNRR